MVKGALGKATHSAERRFETGGHQRIEKGHSDNKRDFLAALASHDISRGCPLKKSTDMYCGIRSHFVSGEFSIKYVLV